MQLKADKSKRMAGLKQKQELVEDPRFQGLVRRKRPLQAVGFQALSPPQRVGEDKQSCGDSAADLTPRRRAFLTSDLSDEQKSKFGWLKETAATSFCSTCAAQIRGMRTHRRWLTSALFSHGSEVFDAAVGGGSLFFTGGAGTGKTFLLKQIIQALPKEGTFITASTGVAASHIGGTTLNAFAGVSMGSTKLPRSQANWQKAKRLIIDEISMVDGRYFDEVQPRRCILLLSPHLLHAGPISPLTPLALQSCSTARSRRSSNSTERQALRRHSGHCLR